MPNGGSKGKVYDDRIDEYQEDHQCEHQDNELHLVETEVPVSLLCPDDAHHGEVRASMTRSRCCSSSSLLWR